MLMGLAGLSPATSAQTAMPIEGVWLTKQLSEVTIERCEAGFCGRISKIVVPPGALKPGEDISGIPVESFTDQRNKDPALRERPILGLQILTLVDGAKAPHVYDGQIYNPEDGNTYSGYVEMLSEDAMRLNGCVLFNVVCRGEDWVRVKVEPGAQPGP